MTRLTEQIIGAAIEVHRALGPGLLESAYQVCLARELAIRRIYFQTEVPLPVTYKGHRLDCGYRLDFLVDGEVVVEIKAVDAIPRVHEAQLLSYMRLGGWQVGFLINFNVELLKDGISRKVISPIPDRRHSRQAASAVTP